MAEAPEELEGTEELFPDEEEPTADEMLDASTQAIEGADADDDIEIVDAEPIPLGRSWAFDFSIGQFVRNGNQPATLRGDATLKAWIEKCLRTAQGSSVVLPPDFGLPRPLGEYIGDDPEEVADLEADIVETLTTHPNIEAVESFAIEEGDEFDGPDSVVEISFTVVQPDGNNMDYSEMIEDLG